MLTECGTGASEVVFKAEGIKADIEIEPDQSFNSVPVITGAIKRKFIEGIPQGLLLELIRC